MAKRILLPVISLVLILAMCLPLAGCGTESAPASTGGSQPSQGPGPVPSTGSKPLMEKTSVIGLPGQEVLLEVPNTDGKPISIGQISDHSVLTATAISDTMVKVQLLAEGKATFVVAAGGKEATVNVRCMDLKIENTEDHLNVGESLDLQLSYDVDATFSVTGIGAKAEGNRITATAEGAFTVVASYGDIILEKKMDSFPRSQHVESLERDSLFVRYYGRNTHLDGEVIMNNTGSGFEVTFYGTELYADLSAWYGAWYGFTQISVMVDGDTDTTKNVVVLNKATTKTAYPLVTGLEEGLHTVKVLKRTEALSTSMTLHGLHTDGYFKPADRTEKLKIEVYGDSITAGYGNLRPNSNPDGTDANTQSGLQTYATYAAWALGAEINVQARSGIGMYTSGNIDDSMQVNTGYAYVNYDQAYSWNFENYTPNIVIINLGTNDYWNPAVFQKEKFVEEYVGFVKKLAAIYGEDTAFVLVSGLMEREVDTFVQQVQTELESQIPNLVLRHQFKQCAYGHPLAAEHLAASQELVALLKANNLDKLPQKEQPVEPVPDPKGENVSVDLTVSLADQLPGHVTLWVEGLGEKQQLEKIDSLHYGLKVTVAEGDYILRFLLNGEEAYGEQGQGHVLQVRAGKTQYSVTPNTFVNVPVNENPFAETKGWHMSAALFPAEFQAAATDGLTVTNRTNWMAAFVTRRAEYADNYLVSVDLSTAAGAIDPAKSFLGVMPYFVDDLNYVVCYLEFTSQNTLKSITATGAENGVSIGFHMFDKFAGQPFDGNAHLEVSRCGKLLTVTMNGITQTKPISAMNQDNAEVGVWTMNPEPVTYTGLTQTQVAPEDIPVMDKWTISPALFDVSFTEGADGVIRYTNQNWMAGFLLTQAVSGDNYQMSMTIRAEQDGFNMADDKFIGALAYYKDQSNFVTVYLQWDQQNKLKSIGCTGTINGSDIGWHDIWSFAGVETHLTRGETLTVSRNNTTITVSYGGMTGSVDVSALNGLQSDYVGLWCCKTACEYSDFQHTAK